MTDTKLGVLPGADITRDAVHVAIVSLMAGTHVKPGDHVGWNDEYYNGSGVRLISVYAREKFGVVDPFLVLSKEDTPYGVAPGTRVWVCLYPASITALRHVWSHPLFNDEPVLTPKSEAETRLRELAATVNVDYEEFLTLLESKDQVYFSEECYHLYEHEENVKQDFYTITGRRLAGLPSFRCSC